MAVAATCSTPHEPASISPTRNIPANIHVEHTQLRDLISCIGPESGEDILHVSTNGLSARNFEQDQPEERIVPGVSFAPTCVTTGSGLIAAGGVHAELFLAPITSIPPPSFSRSSSPPPLPQHQNWASTLQLHGSINNALSFSDLALASSPWSLPDRYDAVGQEPRLFVSNNDCTMRVYNVATRISKEVGDEGSEWDYGGGKKGKGVQRLKKAGVLHAKTCVNHASVSPNGRTLLVAGDTPSAYLYQISGGPSISFDPISTHSNVFTDAAFSTAWSSDGMKYAVASQDGCVKVWDVRSWRCLSEMWGVEGGRRRVRRRTPTPMTSPRRGVPSGMEPRRADGAQYMTPFGGSSVASTSVLSSIFGHSSISSSTYPASMGYMGFPSPIPIIPDTEMDLVVPGVRSLKFVQSDGVELLAFTEHLSHVHLVEARSYNDRIMLRVPPPPPFYPSTSSSSASRASSSQTPTRPPLQTRPAASYRPPPRSNSDPPALARSASADSISAHAPSTLQIPSLYPPSQIQAQARQQEQEQGHDPWPASIWCSPTSPTATGSGANDARLPPRERERQAEAQSQQPPVLYADVRTNAPTSSAWYDYSPSVTSPPATSVLTPHTGGRTGGGFVTRGLLSGMTYEFLPPPSQSALYRREREGDDLEEGEIGDDGDENDENEDKPLSPLAQQQMDNARFAHPLMTRVPLSFSPFPDTSSSFSSSRAPPPVSSLRPSHPSVSSPAQPPPHPPPSNIRIVHHPATHTRASYDSKNYTTHLSGLTFGGDEGTGGKRWMYVSTERSIVQYDVADLLPELGVDVGGGSRGEWGWGSVVSEAPVQWA